MALLMIIGLSNRNQKFSGVQFRHLYTSLHQNHVGKKRQSERFHKWATPSDYSTHRKRAPQNPSRRAHSKPAYSRPAFKLDDDAAKPAAQAARLLLRMAEMLAVARIVAKRLALSQTSSKSKPLPFAHGMKTWQRKDGVGSSRTGDRIHNVAETLISKGNRRGPPTRRSPELVYNLSGANTAFQQFTPFRHCIVSSAGSIGHRDQFPSRIQH